MVSRSDEKYVLYPVYFDRDEPRPLRRVPKELGVHGPTADQVAKACAQLRLKPVIQRDNHHPSRWNEQEGRVLVPVRGSKEVLIRQIGEKLSELRASDQTS